VFRAIILTIVLTFTAASSPSPLCMVCCHAAAAFGSGCHNDMSSMAPRITANQDCHLTFNSAAVRDELRPTLSAPAAGDAQLNVVHTILDPSRERDLRARPWAGPPLPQQQRSLTVLRI
jgi:hypothetical protein